MKTPHFSPSLVVIVAFLLALTALAQTAAPPAEPGAVYLSDLPEENPVVGFGSFGKNGHMGFQGLRVSVNGTPSPKGLSTHAKAKGQASVGYSLGGQYGTFKTEVAVNDDAAGKFKSSLTFLIKGDGKELWRSTKVTKVAVMQAAEVSVAGVRKLELIVDCPGAYDYAQAVWVEPRLFKSGAAPAVAMPDKPSAPTTPAAPAPALSGKIVQSVAWLKEQAAPTFRSGHTLPPLTRWGWPLPLEAVVELADRWGYSLEISLDRGGGGPETAIRNLDDPSHVSSQLVAMVAANPRKYQLAVVCSQSMPPRADAPPETWTRDKDGRFITTTGERADRADAQGVSLLLSPEAPDSYWQEAGRLCAEALRKVRAKSPIAVILNGGEYGLAVEHGNRQHWERDPRIVTAKGKRTWHEYLSASYGRQHRHVTAAVHQAVPDCRYYIHYTGGYTPYRMRDDSAQLWEFDYGIAKGISDLPNCAVYFKGHFDTDWIWKAPFGDCLTVHLNGKTYQIECGTPLSYEWFTGGWCRQADQTDTHMVSDLPRYMGYLKCSYVAGTLGGVAGYFSPQPGGGYDAAFDMSQVPPFLQQIVALSEVHALFSHYEDIIRNGDLLPGPDQHRWSKDLPAYEFPTDGIARVLARKHKQRDEWLLTAWAADGKDRDVSVTIAKLGKVTLRARATGSVYLASKGFAGTQLKLLDEDGLRPTPRLGTSASSAAPVALTITPPAEVNAATDPQLAALHTAWTARFDAEANKPFETALAALNASYTAALGRVRAAAKNNGALNDVLAIDAEIQQIKTSAAPGAAAADTPPALTTLRKTWRDTSAKHATARDTKLAQLQAQYAKALDALIIELTKANKIDEAKRAQQFRDGLPK